MSLLPDMQSLLDMVASASKPALREISPVQARQMVDDLAQSLDLPGEPLAVVRDLRAETAAGFLSLRLYASAESSSGPLVVYLHGGGWVIGSLTSHDGFCRHLAHRLGLRVLALDYRLAPEHPFPAAYEDGRALLDWLADSPPELGGPIEILALAGDSAGANLAAALSIPLAAGRLAALLLLYPVTDLRCQAPSYQAFAEGYLLERADMEFFRDAYLPDSAMRTDPRVSPLLADDLSGMPPTVLLTCGYDVLRDEGRAFGARLVEAGVRLCFHESPGHTHGIVNIRGALPSAVPVLDACIDDLQRLLT